MKVLVTGSAGFVGRHVVRRLTEKGHSVFGVDIKGEGLRVDVRNRGALGEAFREVKPECVVHLAAFISPPESMEKPVLYIDNNAFGTVNVCEEARKHGVSRLIYFSSAAVYGEPSELPLRESSPVQPVNPYGTSKLMAESAVRGYSMSFGIKHIIFRPSNIYGIGQNPEYAGVMHAFAKAIADGKNPVIFGDGEQTRDFIHINDVAEAVVMAVEGNVENRTFNLSSGAPVTVNSLSKMFIKAYGKDINFVHGPPRKGDIYRSELSNEMIVNELGWKPKVKIEDGVKEILNWYVK